MTKFKDKYGSQEVRALSWKQPYASLMLHGKVETRTWDTKYRGWVLICASKHPYNTNSVNQISGAVQMDRIFKTIGAEEIPNMPIKSYIIQNDKFQIGQAIAIGYLEDCFRMERFADLKLSIEERCFVKYSPNLYMHIYKNVQAIEPFDWKGSQGWKKLDQETIDKIILI